MRDFIDGSCGGFTIEVSPDQIDNYRSIYTCLDFLGDVGGLISILSTAGKLFVPWLSKLLNHSVTNFLQQRLYQDGDSKSSEILGQGQKIQAKMEKKSCCSKSA